MYKIYATYNLPEILQQWLDIFRQHMKQIPVAGGKLCIRFLLLSNCLLYFLREIFADFPFAWSWPSTKSYCIMDSFNLYPLLCFFVLHKCIYDFLFHYVHRWINDWIKAARYWMPHWEQRCKKVRVCSNHSISNCTRAPAWLIPLLFVYSLPIASLLIST